MQTIRHVLTEIGGKLTDAGLRPHLWLGRIPDRRGHGKEPEAVIHQMLQQELLIVQALPVANRRNERRSCQAPRGRLDEANPPCVVLPEHPQKVLRGFEERKTRAKRHARVVQRRRDLLLTVILGERRVPCSI